MPDHGGRHDHHREEGPIRGPQGLLCRGWQQHDELVAQVMRFRSDECRTLQFT